MFTCCCPCKFPSFKKGEDDPQDRFQRQYSSRKADSNLDDALKRNFTSIRGRKDRIRNIKINVLPTPFDNDPSSTDDNDDVTPAVFNGMFAGQNFDRIRSWCLRNQQLFLDPMFPPTSESLYINCPSSRGYTENEIIWIRASEISPNPRFFVDGASRFDIEQGELGDCWLLAAMVNLTLHPKLFENVVPVSQRFTENYTGLFHFKIWQYGEWIDVVVDDYLPTKNGKLVYVKSATQNEFWPALLEKAYAKLFGSYEAIKSGSSCEAMVDFCGGCSENIEIPRNKKDQQDLYDHLLKSFNHSSMITCYINPDSKIQEEVTPSGLIKGHAYSITKILWANVRHGKKKGLFPLIRVRNPWGGQIEWKGDWSDNSPVWKFVSDEEKEAIGLNFEHDGEFYMSQKDFMEHFDVIELTHLKPNSLDNREINSGKVEWDEVQFNGTWIGGKNAGGCRNYIDTFAENPQYLVVVEDGDKDGVCTTVISLMQKGTRERKADCQRNGSLPIGFVVYALDPGDETSSSYKYSVKDTTVSMAGQLPLETEFFHYNLMCARSPSFINAREVSGRFKFVPGSYVIIPSTFEPDMEGDYLLRILSEQIIVSDQFR